MTAMLPAPPPDGTGARGSHFYTFTNLRKNQNPGPTGHLREIGPRPSRGAGGPEALPDSFGTSTPGSRETGGVRGDSEKNHEKGRIQVLSERSNATQIHDF